MIKASKKILIVLSILLMGSVFVPLEISAQNTQSQSQTQTQNTQQAPNSTQTPADSTAVATPTITEDSDSPSFWVKIGRTLILTVATLVLRIFSFFLGIGALLLNKVIEITILDMAQNYGNLKAIEDGWSTVRDVGNMFFIFILLYAAIQTILGTGTRMQETIKNIVIAAISVNFSLFFTKIIIDASNILALTFYKAMVGNGTHLGDSIMSALSLQGFYDIGNTTNGLEFGNITVVAVMGSILFLITAFVFLSMAMLFVIRYVVLIFVLILSPLYFLSFALPNVLGSYRKKWSEALKGQAFFAPVFMFMMWIALLILKRIDLPHFLELSTLANINGAADPATATSLLLNFAVVITTIVIALMVSKDWANKAGTHSLTRMASQFSGGVLFGSVGSLGRNTLGKYGKNMADNAELQRAAREEKGWAGARARLGLNLAKKSASGSFDFRKASVPTGMVGEAIEGTIGRTKIGKKLNLDEVRGIPLIGVGEGIKAGQPMAKILGAGEGSDKGYKELTSEKGKRMAARQKEADNEYRKAQNKLAIKAGATSTATATEITEMQKVIKDMSAKEVAALDKNTLASENVAKALTANHLKAINDNEDMSDMDKRKIFEAKFKDVESAVENIRTTGGTQADKNIVKNISDKEMEFIPTKIFDPNRLDPADTSTEAENSRAFLKTLSQGQADSLTKGDKYVSTEKQAIKDARTRPLRDALSSSNFPVAINIMSQMSPGVLAKLDVSDLANPGVADLYSPALLNKLAAQSDLTQNKADAIRRMLETAASTTGASASVTAAANWLQGDGLKIF